MQMIMRPKTRSISLAIFFFFLRLWLSHMSDRHVYYAHPAGEEDQKSKGAVCDFGWDVAHR